MRKWWKLATEAWSDLTAPAPVDPGEREAETRRSVRTLLDTAEALASQAELHDLARMLRGAQQAAHEGLERRAGDRLWLLLAAERMTEKRFAARNRDAEIRLIPPA